MKNKNQELTKAEFTCVCDSLNGTQLKLNDGNLPWMIGYELLDFFQYSFGDRKHGIDPIGLLVKIEGMTFTELLIMLQKVDIFWGTSDEYYQSWGVESPDAILGNPEMIISLEREMEMINGIRLAEEKPLNELVVKAE